MNFSRKYQLTLAILLSTVVISIFYSNTSINHTIFRNGEETDNLILSNKKVFSVIDNPPSSEKWTVIQNDGLIFPDQYGIDSDGIYISYEWNDSLNSFHNVRWKRDVNIKEDMSNYHILSASISTIVNASVHADNGSIGGIDAGGDDVDVIENSDYIRFSVSINTNPIGYFMPSGLGNDTSGSFDFLPDTCIDTIGEELLIYYLNQVLKNDHHNFSMIIGIEIFDEDNYILTDVDYWDKIRIKFFNLSFTYELDTPPSIQIYEPIANQLFGNSAPNFNISISDPYLDSVWYTMDNGFTNVTIIKGYYGDYPLYGTIKQTIWDNLIDGLIFLRFYANDSGGLLNQIELSIYKDSIAPISSLYFIPFGGTNTISKSTVFYLSAVDDPGSGVSRIFYKINNSDWFIYNNPFKLSNFNYGYYNISFYATDNAQNKEKVNSILVLLAKSSSSEIAGYDLIYIVGIISVISSTLLLRFKKKMSF